MGVAGVRVQRRRQAARSGVRGKAAQAAYWIQAIERLGRIPIGLGGSRAVCTRVVYVGGAEDARTRQPEDKVLRVGTYV